MIRIVNILTGTFLLFIFLAGCEDKATLTYLSHVNFPGSISVSEDHIVITEADTASNLLTVNWDAVDYRIDAAVTYKMQMTTPDDSSAWSYAYEETIGEDIYTASFTGKNLNSIVIDRLGYEPDVSSPVVIRVISYVDREAYSTPTTIYVTPYKVEEPEQPDTNYSKLWVAGGFQGWDITNSIPIVSVNKDSVYEGYFYFPETTEFKLYAQQAWEPMSYGTNNGDTVFEANYAGSNFIVTDPGYYLFTVDLNTMTYLLMKTEWGIIGDASPGGWTTDTELTYNESTQTWSVTADMLASGSFKFRANKEWKLDFGIDENEELAYANHPWKEYVERPQLTVPADGNYTITLDLHEAGNYLYTIKAN